MYTNRNFRRLPISLETFLKALKNKEAYHIILDSSSKYFTANIYYNQKRLVPIIQPPDDIFRCLLKNFIPFYIVTPDPFYIRGWRDIIAWGYTLTDFQSNSIPTWLFNYKEYPNNKGAVLIAFKTWKVNMKEFNNER